MKPVILEEGRKNPGHYVPGMIAGGMLYISGQLPVLPETGQLIEGGIEEQAGQALFNLERVLRAAGAAREQVVQCRIYIPDMGYWDQINKIYGAFFGSHRPARVVVPTKELHYGALIEVEAVAELEEQG